MEGHEVEHILRARREADIVFKKSLWAATWATTSLFSKGELLSKRKARQGLEKNTSS